MPARTPPKPPDTPKRRSRGDHHPDDGPGRVPGGSPSDSPGVERHQRGQFAKEDESELADPRTVIDPRIAEQVLRELSQPGPRETDTVGGSALGDCGPGEFANAEPERTMLSASPVFTDDTTNAAPALDDEADTPDIPVARTIEQPMSFVLGSEDSGSGEEANERLHSARTERPLRPLVRVRARRADPPPGRLDSPSTAHATPSGDLASSSASASSGASASSSASIRPPNGDSLPLPGDLSEEDFAALTKKPTPGGGSGSGQRAQLKPAARPSEGASAESIRAWTATAHATSKIIPMLLAIFVVLSTIAISIMFFAGSAKNDLHVRVRFLDVGGNPSTLELVQGDTPSHIVVETDPPGVLVVFEQTILGRTPCSADLKVKLQDNIGVELDGPYFEPWVGELSRDLAGDFRLTAKLVRKP
ncbi:MAG: hypothetical protein H6729_11330 [Deltaproteobacteria bacterium]|nr:hypothetical protein [Deltaproteobacteria bacterium]